MLQEVEGLCCFKSIFIIVTQNLFFMELNFALDSFVRKFVIVFNYFLFQIQAI
jgi:hypothetical protein